MTLTRQRTYSVVAGMLLVAFAIALFAAGHGKAATTPTPPPAPEVSVIYVQGEDVATYREYPARTYGRCCDETHRNRHRDFRVGRFVRARSELSTANRPSPGGVSRHDRDHRAGRVLVTDRPELVRSVQGRHADRAPSRRARSEPRCEDRGGACAAGP